MIYKTSVSVSYRKFNQDKGLNIDIKIHVFSSGGDLNGRFAFSGENGFFGGR